MKKFLPYIFTLVIIANILAPISVIFTNNKAQVVAQKAEAASPTLDLTLKQVTKRPTSVGILYTAVGTDPSIWGSTQSLKTEMYITDTLGNVVQKVPQEVMDKRIFGTNRLGGSNGWTGTILFDNLTPSTDYKVSVKSTYHLDYNNIGSGTEDVVGNQEINVFTLALDPNNDPNKDRVLNSDVSTAGKTYEFSCYLNPWAKGGTWSGCFTGIFNVLFGLAARLFGYAGMFFDWTLGYSLDSNSYRSTFVNEGWGIVRDMCNVFFIFILLYVAFATVLNLHGFKTKEMIVNVVIIGLLINFSLFATHLIIDTSNILARVFYNNVEVKVGTSSNGKNTAVAGVDIGVDKNTTSNLGEKHLSALIISKVNPQKILLGAEKLEVKDGSGESNGISASTYLIITFLSIVMCIIGIIVFLSVGLIFISRVIGLWLAMILVPLTFFSYTVPALQDIDMVGWKKWWPETIKLSFLAPVFLFFLYLIIKFLDSGLGLFNADSKDGIQWLMGIIIPFIFLMVLLWKAKGIATKMSGELGQQITGALAATAGLALGGAALGTAVLGRKVIGQTMARASRGDTLTQRYDDTTKRAKMNGLQKSVGWVGSKLGMGSRFGNTRDAKGIIINGLGGAVNKQKKRVSDVEHSRHEWDDAKKKNHLDNIDDSNLSGVELTKIENSIKNNKRSEAEAMARKGKDVNGNDKAGWKSEEEFKRDERKTLSDEYKKEAINLDSNGDLTDAAKKNIENDLSAMFNQELKVRIEGELSHYLDHVKEGNKGMADNGEGKMTRLLSPQRVFANANSGSWDARELSKVGADKRANTFVKMGSGLVAGVALGVRTGLKNGLSVNHGTSQKDFFKDLSHTFTEAMKSAKVDVKVSAPHGGGDHGGGHDDHGGGHH